MKARNAKQSKQTQDSAMIAAPRMPILFFCFRFSIPFCILPNAVCFILPQLDRACLRGMLKARRKHIVDLTTARPVNVVQF
jgi:hypothetical protein